MRISVKTHPKSKQSKVVQIDPEHYEVWVHEPPDKGKANQAVIEAISSYLGIAKSTCSLVSGHTSRHKVIAIG